MTSETTAGIDEGTAGAGPEAPDFETQTAPLRTELLAHCYRMMGSAVEAEDAVQETYLRAWRAFHGFEGRSSVRTWMYRIATNTCLNALSSASRRVLPQGLGGPPGDPTAPLNQRLDEAWLEPLPDAMLWTTAAPTPEEQLLSRENVTIAWTTALQNLPPNQRAVLLLREVLQLSAEETAETLGTTVASVNSALQRCRASIGEGLGSAEDAAAVDPAREEAAVAAFVDAFERHDFDAVVASLAADVTWQMPPFDRWYAGAEASARLSWTHCPATGPGDLRYLVTRANGQPAVGMYLRKGRDWEAFQFQVLRVDAAGKVDDVVGFFDAHLFRLAGLPLVLEAA
ncbi:MAG: RNA polymerase sigma-70 factor [uncultured Nocardioides sp.]|uniref:RNA polymerase sigma-70 factor n=1 Tax=uncultured Nocardioides sp. TaxID=198441 RepID=A0A6J4N0W2_9ACTN|nr:MAG: RNA polymerase sigma-70 factor [uncultured Nocardioides sp.]